MTFRDRMLGGVSFRAFYSPDEGGATTTATTTSTAGADATTTTSATTTALATGDATTATTQVTAPADWPKDWREKLAGDDKGFLNQLQRYGSPLDVGRWLRTTQLKISAGELREPPKGPPENATAEQLVAWRKEQGLPAAPADYVTGLKLGEGMVPGEADKPLLEAVAAMAHGKNYSQDAVNDFVGMYYQLQNKMVGQRAEADQDYRIQAEQQLLKVMGDDFKPSMQALKSFWAESGVDAGVQDAILSARTADGRILGNVPEFTQLLAWAGRTMNPAATLLPPGTDGSPASIDTRMKAIESQMYIDGKPNPGYFNTPLEAEYRGLIEAQQRMKERAA